MLERPDVEPSARSDWRSRLRPLVDGGGWNVTLAVTLLAGLLRFIRLDQPATGLTDKGQVDPAGHIFDEVYYACDAHNLVTYGYERATQQGAPFCTPGEGPAFVVHPPLGKWLIGLGEKAFGFDTFGWRFAAALFGTLTVLLLVRIGRRMTGSTLLGGLAGLLLALDGLHFVQSRVAMVDIFLTFFVVAAFGALVVDRDKVRAGLSALDIDGHPPTRVPLRRRPWLLLAGACAGAAVATKWSGLFALVPLIALGLAWETGARRTAGLREPFPWRTALGVAAAAACWVWLPGPGPLAKLLALVVLAAALAWEAQVRRTIGLAGGTLPHALLRQGGPWVVAMVLVPLAVYVLSWSGWFLHEEAWSRTWAEGRDTVWWMVPDVLRSWWHYHGEIFRFHDGLTASHPYQSHPLSWPFLGRPVSYYYPPGIGLGRYGCTVSSCSREVLAIGTPALWWAMIPACIGLVARWASHRDWRAGALLVMTVLPILAWLPSDQQDRTMFLFYALPAIPFLCLGLALLAGWALGAANARRRTGAAVGIGIYVSLVVVNFAWLYPVLAAVTLPYAEWYDRMWFRSWI